MNKSEALNSLDRLRLAINSYLENNIENFSGKERILALDSLVAYAITSGSYHLAVRHLSEAIEILMNNINIRHC